VTETEQSANQYVACTNAQWKELVVVAHGTPPKQVEKTAKAIATAAGVGWQTVREKIEAIQSAVRAGYSDEYIIGRGQKQTIADYRKAKADKRLDPYVVMGWRVTAETRFAVQSEIVRICKILHIRESETFFTWLHAEMSGWTPPQLRHSAGEPRLKKCSEEK
jgi:YesN/AraC family two-component response regulator